MNNNKSVLSFGLLLSSLVMLSAIPLLSSNNNPAMAQGYDDYYSDSYSTYPTDDKKYECQTGPFEGFFVGSVEFCKFKFDDKDDRKDNQTGAQGPQGPAGPQGLPGAASTVPGPRGFNGTDGIDGLNGTNGLPGPPGITQLINGTNVYFVTNITINSEDEPSIEAVAQCQPGDFVINGGYRVDGADSEITETLVDTQITDPPGGGWRVLQYTEPAGPSTVALIVNAYCFDNTP